MSLTDRLLEMKEQADAADDQYKTLQGQLKAELATLQEDFDVSTLEDAQETLAELKKDWNTKQAKLEKKVEELEEAFPWEED